MTDPLHRIRRFLSELRRRDVYKVGVAYLVAAFVVLQLADLAAGAFGFPGWFEPMIWVVAGLGFPLALVLAWAFERTPEGVRRTPAEATGGAAPSPAAESEGAPQAADDDGEGRGLDLRAAMVIGLIGLASAGIWYVLGSSGDSVRPSGDRSIAVVPFEARVAESEDWGGRDIAFLLSKNLDGAGNLRAISDRAVFAEWDARVSSERSGSGSAPSVVDVARDLGARYAVDGSASTIAGQLHLNARVVDARSGERLDQVDVDGPADSVTALTDELTRGVLEIVLEAGTESVPAVDLERITTNSVRALKEFLGGVMHHRGGEIALAIEAYEAAIAEDSAFALAHLRLSNAEGFLWAGSNAASLRSLDRANQLSHRLPTRERGAARGLHLWRIQGRALAASDTLRRLTRSYPKAPTLWMALGEVLFHASVPRGHAEADDAFRRAIDLNPEAGHYRVHITQLGFSFHRDSVLAAERVAAHPRLQGSYLERHYPIVMDLLFGTEERRQGALDSLSTVPVGTPYTLVFPLQHPVDGGRLRRVLRRLQERDDVELGGHRARLPRTALERGQVDTALAELRELRIDAESTTCMLAKAQTLGVPVPDSALDPLTDLSRMGQGVSRRRLRCAALHRLERNPSTDLDPWLARMRGLAGPPDEDAPSEAEVEASVDEIRGFWAWKRGDLDRAARLWSRANASGVHGAIWRGDLYRELGRPDRAEGWYLAAWEHPVAHERLGAIYEETDRREESIAAYRRFVTAWAETDGSLYDRVERARERMATLTRDSGAGTGSSEGGESRG